MKEQDKIKNILAIVKDAITKEHSFVEDFSVMDWEELYQLAQKSKCVALLYDSVEELAKTYDISENLRLRWKKEAMGYMLYEYNKYFALRTLLEKAKEQDILCIFFKGCVLADLYPKYYERTSSDADILVYEKDRDKAVQLLESLGYIKDEEESKELVYVYTMEKIMFQIELHFSLWEDYTGAKIERLEQMNLTDPNTLVELEACGLNVHTLGYEEHLVYQMFHIIKHFSLQGVSIRYLVDITLYINRYESYISKDAFWEKMDQIGYSKFCENFFYLCIQYLGMSPAIMEEREIQFAEKGNDFVLDLIHVGTLFEDKDAGWQLLGIMTPYFNGEANAPKSNLRRKLRILFPKREHLPEEYAYAKKHAILLPAAWIHKLASYLVKWYKHKDNWYDAKEKLKVAEHRLALMGSLGLLEEDEKSG